MKLDIKILVINKPQVFNFCKKYTTVAIKKITPRDDICSE